MPGAVLYDVHVNGQYADLTADPQLFNRNLPAGVHSLSVQAIDGSGNRSPRSGVYRYQLNSGSKASSSTGSANRADNAVTSRSSGDSFGTPSGISGVQIGAGSVRWNWNAVPDASRYQITVDGRVAGEVNGTEHVSNNLWIGEHSLTVRAISNTGQMSGQSATAVVNVGQRDSASGGKSDAVTLQASNEQSLIDPTTWSQEGLMPSDRYELVFSDEFNASNLNSHRWHTQLRWDGEWNGERYEYRRINNEHQFYVNVNGEDSRHRERIVPVHNPFEFNGSHLSIRAVRNPLKTNNNKAGHGNFEQMLSQQDFLSGAISTHDKFSQKYGYFEARIRIPGHTGTFPAFWLYHQKRRWEGTRRTEIDIMENLGHAPQYIYNSFHYFTNVTSGYSGDAHFLKPQPQGQIFTGTDYSQDFHTYAVEWEPGKVTWFIDGEQVSELTNANVDYEELFLIINLAIGGSWTNFPTNSGGLGRSSDQFFPNGNDFDNWNNPSLDIDYVRVYRRR